MQQDTGKNEDGPAHFICGRVTSHKGARYGAVPKQYVIRRPTRRKYKLCYL
jgi:hypothetical protein